MNFKEGFNSSKDIYKIEGGLNNLGYFDILKQINDMDLHKVRITGFAFNSEIHSPHRIEIDKSMDGVIMLRTTSSITNVYDIKSIQSFNGAIKIELNQIGASIIIK